MKGLPRLSIRQLSRLLSADQITSEQLCSYCRTLAVVGDESWNLHAFANLHSQDDVLKQARLSDERRRKGQPLSILDGIPISVKANIAVDSLPLTAGSRILGAGQKATPAVGYDADVVWALKQSGAIVLGTTNLDEFGMGSLGTHTATPTKNPRPLLNRMGQTTMDDQSVSQILQLPAEAIFEAHTEVIDAEDDVGYSAGGSSCGSAASVAHGSSLLSLGTDTGGSVRLPAAWCNVVGLKPSYGRLSRHGLVGYASSLDCAGILAPSVDCANLALHEIVLRQSSSHHDSTLSFDATPFEVQDLSKLDKVLLKGVKVGIPAAFSVSECPSSLREAWSHGAERLQACGATIEIVDTETIFPDILQKSLAAYYVLASAEASSNLARYDGFRYGVAAEQVDDDDFQSGFSLLERQYAAARTEGFHPEVARRILCGTSVLSSDRFHTYYEAAAKLRAVLTRQLHAALQDYDVLLVPTTVFPPAQLDSPQDQTEMFANDVMTVPISLAGLPAVSVPTTTLVSDNCPFQTALQVIGPRHGEASMLRVAAVLEQCT